MEHLSQKRKLSIIFAIMAAMFFSSINQTIIGVALPKIIAVLDGMEYYSWVISIYLLTSTIATILAGKLSDIYGRKYFILAGIIFFMIGAFLSGTSANILQLIAFRGVQGIGSGIIMATAFTAIGDLFSPRERGRWSGLMSAVFGISSVLGPGLGGYIVDHLNWSWVFWLFLPLGLVAFLMILFLFPKVERRKSESIDYFGSIFLTMTIVSMLLAFSWAGTKYAWGSPVILGLFAFMAVSCGIFIRIEMKVKSPILPLRLFKNSVVSISNIIGFIMNAGMMGALMYMPLFVQGVKGISATYAGYVTMPMSLGMFAISALAGNLMTKTGKYKKLAVAGISTMVVGMLTMCFMINIPIAVISMSIFGVGLGLSMPVFTIAVQNATDQKDLGVATASTQLFRQLGATIGIAFMGTVLSTSTSANLSGSILSVSGIQAISKDPKVIDLLSQFRNPQLLLDKAKLAVIQEQLPAPLQSSIPDYIEALRQALSAALTNVFAIGVFILGIALLLTFFLKEVPLRTTMDKEKRADSVADPQTAVAVDEQLK